MAFQFIIHYKSGKPSQTIDKNTKKKQKKICHKFILGRSKADLPHEEEGHLNRKLTLCLALEHYINPDTQQHGR